MTRRWVASAGAPCSRPRALHGGRLSVWGHTKSQGVRYWRVSLASLRAGVETPRVTVALVKGTYGVGDSAARAAADARASGKTLEEALAAAEEALLAREAAERLGYQAPGRGVPC